MSLPSTTVLEVRQNGSDTNGGGFSPISGGIDYSQQAAAQYALTNGVTNGTTTIGTVSASSDMVGNLAYITGGTGSVVAGWYHINGQVTGVSITVDRSTGLTAGTGVTINIGGALATPGLAALLMTNSGIRTWVKYSATSYSLTTSTIGAAGPISLQSGIICVMEGYDIVRGDRTGNRPTYKWTAASPGVLTYIVVMLGSAFQSVINMALDANQVANVSGVSLPATKVYAVEMVVLNANQTSCIGYSMVAGSCERCKAITCTTGFSYSSTTGGCSVSDCYSATCTTGFLSGSFGGGTFRCLATGCTNGFSNTGGCGFYSRCTADGNTTAGFVNSSTVTYISCISSNQSGGGGIGFSLGSSGSTLINCAVYNNSTHISGTAHTNENQITLTSDPYVSRTIGDFRPNNQLSGNRLRNAGIGVFGQTDNSDVGAIQHGDKPVYRGRRGV